MPAYPSKRDDMDKQRGEYLRTQGLQLHGGHAHQLHALLIVGDGAGQVCDLEHTHTHTRYTKTIETDQDPETLEPASWIWCLLPSSREQRVSYNSPSWTDDGFRKTDLRWLNQRCATQLLRSLSKKPAEGTLRQAWAVPAGKRSLLESKFFHVEANSQPTCARFPRVKKKSKSLVFARVKSKLVKLTSVNRNPWSWIVCAWQMGPS